MALLSIKREVDIMPGVSAPVVFHVSQGDVGTSVILGLLYNGASYTIPTGVPISIIGSASNGAVFTPVSATFSGSDVTFLLSEEMSAVAGPTLCEAVISLNNDVLGTANFIINVEASPMGGDVPPVFTDAAWLWMLNKMETEIVEDIETSPGTDATIINGINEALTTGRATQDALAETDERVDAVAPWFSSSSAYTEGDYVYLSTGSAIKLYRFTADHAAGAWTGTDVEEVTVSEELNRLEGSGSGKADELTIAPEFDTSASYTAGSYVLKNGVLYRFTSAHSGAWTGTDAEVVTVGEELTDLKADLTSLSNGVLVIDKQVNWQAGWINVNGLIASSTASQFALVPMYAGETITIGTRNSNITIIGSTSADSVVVGDTVTVIQKTTSSNVFNTYTYTCEEAINLVICVRTSEYTLDFKKIAPFMQQKQDVLTFDDVPMKNSENPVKSDGVYNAINNYFYVSSNIANPTEFVVGEYVNQVTGAFSANTGQTRTGYVPVVGGHKYCIVNNTGAGNLYIRYMFYKSDKTYISGSGAYVLLSDIGHIVTAPSDAAFLVMSATSTGFPYMVAPSDAKIDYEEYGEKHLKPEYAPKGGASAILNIPSTIYALVGYELNIYFENITVDWEKYKWNVNCSVGIQLERGYRITPNAADVGTYPIAITAESEDGTVTTVFSSLVITSASSGSGQSKSIIVLGDSTTNNGTVIEKLNENFANDVMNVSTLGTRGTAPNNHEGRSGWTLTDYFTMAYIDYTDGRGHVENPFYNPSSQTFDASYYFANSGIAQPDWFIINMGINDMFSYTSDSSLETQIETCIDYLHSMITSIHSVSTSIKVGICVTIPPNHSQDAFGKAYACGQTRDRYKRNNVIWANAIISEFDGEETNGIYVIPIHTNLDTVNNMGMETMSVNARNTAVTYESPIANGGVHPATSGYWQIADVYTAFLKANT